MKHRRKGPLISLVVIVKNDAEMLAGCLERHRPLYDEAVVVDTGSTDDTRERAAALGARVVDFPWCDDFAAARNAGLAQARGRWVLCLDADERIAACDLSRLGALVRRSPLDRCYLFAFRTYTDLRQHAEWHPVEGEYAAEEAGASGYVVAVNVRLFPRRSDLRYHGCVHETVEPDIRRLGFTIHGLDIPVHHYGLVRSAGVMATKDDLYGRLVRAKHRQDPANSGACLELACRLIMEQNHAEALPLLEDLAKREESDAHVQRARLYLAHARRRQGQLAEAEALLRGLLAECPQWPQPWIELARTLANSSRWSALAELLRQAHPRFPDHPLLVREEVVVLAASGRVGEAAQLAAGLAARHPGWAEARALADALARSPLAQLETMRQ